MLDLGSWPLPVLLLAFVVSAGLIWVSGVKLSETTDVLDSRFHLGSAFGGLIVLAVATNLPEIAITVSASASGEVEVAVGNILGGIGLQTVVLAVLDFFGERRKGVKPLTHRAASLTLVLEALVVVAVLVVVVAGSQLPVSLELARLTPAVVLIAVLWAVGLFLVQRAGRGLPWHEDGEAPGSSPHPKGHRTRKHERDRRGTGRSQGSSTGRAAAVFVVAALVTMMAGVVLEHSGEVASSRVGFSGVLYGATVLSLATSLPEISTGLQAIKQGDDNLAMSDIFGGNAFLPVLFVLATLITGRAVLPGARSSDIYLTALAALLTLVYAVGLIFRPSRRIAGLGVDSAVVVVLYLVGVAGLVAVAR